MPAMLFLRTSVSQSVHESLRKKSTKKLSYRKDSSRRRSLRRSRSFKVIDFDIMQPKAHVRLYNNTNLYPISYITVFQLTYCAMLVKLLSH